MAWHRGIKSTFSGTQWKDEKTVQGNASLAAVKSCNSHRLELQQGGNFQRCSDPVISSLMWCDADSNRMHLGGNTLPAQHALISAIQEESSCVNADTNWKSLLGFVAVLVWIVVLLKTSKYTPTRSTLCSYAARSSRRCCWLGLLMPFFFFGSWLELHSGTHGTDVTATYRGDLQASSLTPKVHGSSYGGWWACVNTNQLYDSSMERLDLRRENFHNQGNAKQLEPSALPLTVVVQTEWLVEQRGSQVAAMLTTQPPVAYSTFSEVVVNSGTLYDQAKDPRRLHSALHLLGVGDLMLGNERGYVRSLDAGVRVRASLEVTSTAGCDGRWNFGVVLHDLPTQQYRLGPMAGELYVRFHTTHLANGHIGLIGMDTVESPLRRFASYSLPSVRLGAQTTMGATESLALLLVVEASPSDSTVFVRAMAAGDGSALASLRLCRAEFVALERVGAVSLRVEGDPTCVASEQGLTASGTNRNVVVSLSNFSAEQCVK
eukprot:COSAG02_NODE_1244_length_13677_cov_50.752246_9_plen_490_part_00